MCQTNATQASACFTYLAAQTSAASSSIKYALQDVVTGLFNVMLKAL